ncbi:MAG: hypothetical protein FJ278_16800, partial [Planctomycetes bacterium]|nr:hypothetical protein [Planctomycetota bacterium]
YEIGRDFRYLTSGMLQREALSNAEFRVLLLPMTQALSPDEAAAVRRFAENGGTVIADVRPGMFDAHCKPVTPGLLDDLFGVRRTGRGKAVESPIKLKLTLQGRALDVAFEKARLDAHVEAAAGQALASANNVPAMIVNTVGKGRAILLNFQMAIGAPEDATATAARKLLQFLYDVAEARSAIAVASPNGEPLPTTETRVWRNGDALVFGLWRQMRNAWFSPKKDTVAGEPAPARVALSAPRHVYDLRGRKHLGRVDRVDTRLRWGRASFFLAAPYQIGPLKVALSSPRAGEAVTASITLGIPAGAKERYAVWVEVTDPLGQRPLWGRQVVLLEQGRGQVQFPVAHNDAPGAWRLTATELFSSQSAAASWTVKP